MKESSSEAIHSTTEPDALTRRVIADIALGQPSSELIGSPRTASRKEKKEAWKKLEERNRKADVDMLKRLTKRGAAAFGRF
jgi:hypothetical protein